MISTFERFERQLFYRRVSSNPKIGKKDLACRQDVKERVQKPISQVCLGEKDPWTPPDRVRALDQYPPVQRVDLLPGLGPLGRLGTGPPVD